MLVRETLRLFGGPLSWGVRPGKSFSSCFYGKSHLGITTVSDSSICPVLQGPILVWLLNTVIMKAAITTEARTWTLIFLLATLLWPRVQHVWWISNPSAAYQVECWIFLLKMCLLLQKHNIEVHSNISSLAVASLSILYSWKLCPPWDYSCKTLEKTLGWFVWLNVKINGYSPKKDWVDRSGVKRKSITCLLVCDFEL